jgi:hypothetical protein
MPRPSYPHEIFDLDHGPIEPDIVLFRQDPGPVADHEVVKAEVVFI